MADREDKNEENVDGCVLRRQPVHRLRPLSRDRAREFQTRRGRGYSYVFKQPENDEEREQCKEAMEGCPVEAIGDDGAD